MFSSGHFIWLGVLAVLIAVTLIIIKKCKIPTNAVKKTACFLLIILKIFHLCLSMKESPYGGFVINQTQLSFHLCSLMIYSVILTNVIKNKKFVNTLESFMVPCMLIGAAMALLIPTEGVDVATPRVWQYMLIHGTLVFYGIYLMIIEKADLSFKAFVNNLKLLLVVVVAAFLMNSVLEEYETNFMFLRVPPMEGLPILNLDNGWYIYFLSLTAVACALLFLVHLPFIIRDIIKAKKQFNEDFGK